MATAVAARMENSWSRKRKREIKRLLVNETVEVRSLEDGFLGSWHPGTIIFSGKQKRHVRYKNVLADDGVNYLVEAVNVSEALDGDHRCSSNCYMRGLIRPPPPVIDFGKWDLEFGLCVDVDYQEAWWEGVIYDHCDGMEERSVFFPDLGDELKVEIQKMRITQDWDETTGKWERRGNWVFLELVEERERESYIAISIKQIWYDVREKKDFVDKIREWTFNVKELWSDLVMETISDYFTLTLQELFSVLNLPKDPSKETQVGKVDFNMQVDMANFVAVVKSGTQLSASGNTNVPCDGTPKIAFGHESSDNGMGEKCSTHLKSKQWVPLILPDVEFCPDALEQYAQADKSKKIWKEKFRKHLAHLGWKIERSERVCKRFDYRYIPPDAEGQNAVYFSLNDVCEAMQKNTNMNSLVSQHDQGMMQPTVENHLPHVLVNQSGEIQDLDINSLLSQNDETMMQPTVDNHISQTENSQDLDISPTIVPAGAPVENVGEPEFCPQAAEEYLRAFKKKLVVRKDWIPKAKKHLLALGWTLHYPDPNNKRRGIVYTSPENKKFNTLHGACSFCIESSPKLTSLCKQPLNVPDQICSGDLLCGASQLLPMEPKVNAIKVVAVSRPIHNRKKKGLRNSTSRLPKSQRNRVLRSNKRVQKVSADCASLHKPQNVLSWLIDKNKVLARSKVYYYQEKRKRCTKVEGRITRDGIKCNCCQTVYSLVGFEKHASGSSTQRPSANIFLEDGRSLLDCQIQIMQDYRTRETMGKQGSGSCQADNDSICSVCHYGGDLILCDRCPSSFHQQCLGLEDIPDGEWFCPSCCCGICGQSKINGAEDEDFSTCIQCELKYHGSCLRHRAVDKAPYLENGFCGDVCEKIYAGLRKITGQPVSVGVDNLTWTLVKYIDSESCDPRNSEVDLLAESYSKLNIALSVMHECFMPQKENFSRSGDLMEDVLFSRKSELNRLNFQGFYTVLLERNEELISVANVRIYGEKVAEVPLVGTRLQYRRHGMCRILMNELEKKLMQLGVQRLVLPAVPSVLDTWTRCFGFAKMTPLERSQFLDHTFLDFQDTIMCQKMLMKIPSPDSVMLLESPHKPCDVFSESCGISFNKSSPVSTSYQAEEIDERGKMDVQSADTSAGNSDHLRRTAIDSVTTMVKQQSPETQQCRQNINSTQCSPPLKHSDMSNGSSFVCYKRRRVKGRHE